MAGKDAILANRKRSQAAEVLNTLARTDSKHAFVPPEKLLGRADNRAIKQDRVVCLADSIEHDGLGQPVLVREIAGDPDHYEIVAGHHRCEAFSLLEKRHPEDPAYKTIECIVRPDMDDKQAQRLMAATNVVNADLEPEEYAEMLAILGEQVPKMREEDPSLNGVRTSEIIAEEIKSAGGGQVSARTVERKMQQAKQSARAAQTKGNLISLWEDEFEQSSFPANVRMNIAKLDIPTQHNLYERWEDADKSREWLSTEIDLICLDKAEEITYRAVAAILKSIALLNRAQKYTCLDADTYNHLLSALSSLKEGGTDVSR